MFRVTSAQLDAFRADRMEDFEDRLMADLRSDPDAAGAVSDLDDAALRARVKAAVSRGRTHGFSTERQLAAFVISEAELGEGFETDPRALPAALVLRSGLPADDKAEGLEAVAARIVETRRDLAEGGL